MIDPKTETDADDSPTVDPDELTRPMRDLIRSQAIALLSTESKSAASAAAMTVLVACGGSMLRDAMRAELGEDVGLSDLIVHPSFASALQVLAMAKSAAPKPAAPAATPLPVNLVVTGPTGWFVCVAQNEKVLKQSPIPLSQRVELAVPPDIYTLVVYKDVNPGTPGHGRPIDLVVGGLEIDAAGFCAGAPDAVRPVGKAAENTTPTAPTEASSEKAKAPAN